MIKFTIKIALWGLGILTLISSAESQTWKEFKDSCQLYYSKNQYKPALQFAKLALIQAEKEFTSNDSNYAFNLKLLSELWQHNRNLDSAVYYGKKSIETYSNLKLSGSSSYAEIMGSVALFYDYQKKMDSAAVYFEKALDLSIKAYKNDDQRMSTLLFNYAIFKKEIGKVDEAELLYKEGIGINRRIFKADDPKLANSLVRMGEFYEEIQNYDEAERYYIESLEMCRRLRIETDLLPMVLYDLGNLIMRTGKYENAGKYLEECLKIMQKINPGDNGKTSQILIQVGNCFEKQGRYEEAEIKFKDAVEMNRRISKGPNSSLSTSIFYLANLYKIIGRFDETEKLYKEAMEIDKQVFLKDHPTLAQGLLIMGTFYQEQKNNDSAEKYFKDALEMNRRLYKVDHINLVYSLRYLLSFYNINKMFSEAEPIANELLEMSRRMYKKPIPDLVFSLTNIADIYYGLHKYDIVEKYLDEVLSLSFKLFSPNHSSHTKNIYNAAVMFHWLGKNDKSEPLFLNYISADSLLLKNYFPYLSEAEKKKIWLKLKKEFEIFNQFAVSRSKENPNILVNLYDINLFTKGILFNSTAKMKSRINASNDSLLIRDYNLWTTLKQKLYTFYKLTLEEQNIKGINIDSFEVEANTLEKKLSLRSEDFKHSYENKVINWRTIQTLLKRDEAAIEVIRYKYFAKERSTDTVHYAFLILTNKTTEHPKLVLIENGQQLENEFYEDYRESIRDKKTDKISFERFWGPLNNELKKYKKIYFSPDGIYNKLNPSTLIRPDGKYIFDIQDIQILNSTRDMILASNNSKDKDVPNNNAVLIGNPNFSLSEEQLIAIGREFSGDKKKDSDKNVELANTRGMKLSALPETEKEIRNIEKFLKTKKWNVKSYLGDMAIKDAVKSAENPQVLHIATHGMFLKDAKKGGKEIFGIIEQKMQDNPLLRSGLFFSGAESANKSNDTVHNSDNGILTAYEVMNLDLDRTELVILSACETGLGEISNGEGVYGLQRAFLQAGAKAIIMSLWMVSDKATQELMTSFYKNWVGGKSKREAFNQAQKEIKLKYKDPFYWGGFVMVGE